VRKCVFDNDPPCAEWRHGDPSGRSTASWLVASHACCPASIADIRELWRGFKTCPALACNLPPQPDFHESLATSEIFEASSSTSMVRDCPGGRRLPRSPPALQAADLAGTASRARETMENAAEVSPGKPIVEKVLASCGRSAACLEPGIRRSAGALDRGESGCTISRRPDRNQTSRRAAMAHQDNVLARLGPKDKVGEARFRFRDGNFHVRALFASVLSRVAPVHGSGCQQARRSIPTQCGRRSTRGGRPASLRERAKRTRSLSSQTATRASMSKTARDRARVARDERRW
jgi:hypothetical protein